MKTRALLLFILMHLATCGSAQYLSHLKAVKADALYTTYAASPARSHYTTDQGYQFQWNDAASGVEFISRDGPNTGIAFQWENRLIFTLQSLCQEPVVTTSYSDLVKYFYYPVKEVRVEVFFAVYSSESAITQYRLVNEGHFPVTITVLPYLYYPSGDSVPVVEHRTEPEGYEFSLLKKRDGWMIEHNIPVVENFTGDFQSSLPFDSVCTFRQKTGSGSQNRETGAISMLKRTIAGKKRDVPFIHGIIGSRTFTIQPGESTSFRMITRCAEAEKRISQENIDLEKLVRDDEEAYARVPTPHFSNKDQEMLYWSCFSLMRQCMMPAEGECQHNYYLFSREPRWGWGYGGQVFHESLVMLAYAYMDPEGAMNSQRIFMDRQKPDGYINYRTGPYLNETIITNGKPTTSAPWFNYENLEIFKITGDRRFLKEAYASGKKFYQYYTANRDSNSNGLCEWGAHAELESVRDARVAVWDKVGWASNFEGPDVNSMLVMEARSLAEMAKNLGLPAESNKWKEDAAQRSMLINKFMWDSVSRFYYNVNKKDQSFSFNSPNDLKIKEIIGFLPLWAGIADKQKAEYLVGKMLDTNEFWRSYGVPSLTAAFPIHADSKSGAPKSQTSATGYYCPIGYWNGPVWVQWEYLLYRGLLDYGYDSVADQLATRVLDNMIYHLKKDHVFWEFYSADDRQAGWNKSYIWAGIAARFLLDTDTNYQRVREAAIHR